jgi:hypothetical protein
MRIFYWVMAAISESTAVIAACYGPSARGNRRFAILAAMLAGIAGCDSFAMLAVG